MFIKANLSVKLLLIFFSLVCNPQYANCYSGDADVKPPKFAGSFYPESPVSLSQVIEGFLLSADPKPMQGDIFAIIAPHAGYGYSGPSAAFAYKLIQNRPYKTVIVIGPSHRFNFSAASVCREGAFQTPLGDLEVDKEFSQKLLDSTGDVYFEPRAFAQEHSVEVQLPFLQKVLPVGFKIVPIVMGDCALATCQKLANLLKAAIGSRKDVLVVSSTDMYHGYDYEEADMTDKVTLDYLRRMDPEGLYYALREGKAELCGGFGTVTTLLLSKMMGHDKISVLTHTNSAIVTGKKVKGIWTVGYTACAIDSDKGGNNMLSKAQRKKLLELARNSIETYLKTGKNLEVSENDPVLTQVMGGFVTLSEHGQLRGCIGNIVGKQPLYLTVRDMAVEAATGDPRFPKVTLGEFKDIELEVSALSPLKKVNSADDIILGTHGVVVKRGSQSGVFLPQVAGETKWSKEEFLSELCSQKAGLSPDAWKDKFTELYVFTAEVFSENNY